MPEWLLVDGYSIIFRAFYGVPASVRGPQGTPVNAIRGFLDALAIRLTERRPRRMMVAVDTDWRPAWRVDLLPSYKAHRVAEPVPPLLEPQIPVILECLGAVGVDALGAANYEADDVLATIVAGADRPVEILSGDRDLFSLIEDGVTVLSPQKGGVTVVDDAVVMERFGVPGRLYADLAVLRGDTSDGLPGISGVGPKKAAALLQRHGSVQAMLDKGIFGDRDAAYLRSALKVVALTRDIAIDVPRGRRDSYPANADAVESLGAEHNIAAPLGRLVQALQTVIATH